MKKRITLGLIAFQMIAFDAIATIVINFDTDAFGNPITAPAGAAETTRLDELYALWGVHFFGPDGPDGNDGGCIVNVEANFGLSPHSGINFLGFNRAGIMMDGGTPTDPETITFDILASNISIFVAGGHSVKTFLMQGFDANGVLVASDMAATQGWEELEVSWLPGIKSVVLSVTIPDGQFSRGFVFDDLSVEVVPEASTTSLLICGAALGLALRLRRKRT